jgi:hypothetical protein
LALPTTNFQLNNRKHHSYTGVSLLVKQKTLKAATCPPRSRGNHRDFWSE